MKLSPQKKGELDRLLSFLDTHANDLGAIDQSAAFLYQKGLPMDAALAAYEHYLERQPASATAAFNFAWYLARDGQPEAAIRMYRRALELGIDGPEEVHLNIGNIWMDQLLDNEKARAAFNDALAVKPDYAGAYHNLGNLEEQAGNRDQAAACFRKCLELEPDNHSALARLADTHRFTDADDPLLGQLEEHGATSADSDLHFALGSAYNQLGDYATAWSHFSRANAMDRALWPPYDPAGTEQRFDRIIAQTPADGPERSGGSSPRHVFICGLFRTGSTLLEQMLAAHPEFTAIGESDFFPRLVAREFPDFPLGLDRVTDAEARAWRERHAAYARLVARGAARLVDKRPDNFQFIGVIKTVLPAAKFIVTERDWRDVAISIYGMRLGAGQNYATDLASIRHYIGQQERLVDHWANLLGNDLVRLRYEDLVTQPRDALGRVLENLEADWHERCLAFDTLDTTVKTGSVWQVREPLHARSIGRWKNYRTHFESVFGDRLEA
ncbi:MAG: sulfotransferase [Xanthomonadales bacterium]